MADREDSRGSIMDQVIYIQHIQSFLTRKEAARSTILSKQWYNAWSTNGVLYLDPQSFRPTRTTKRRSGGGSRAGGLSLEFQDFATKSISRYKNMNLILRELRLWMNIPKDHADHEATTRFYDQLILDALSLGVTVIDLNVKSTTSVGHYYTSPPQVFDSTSSKEFSLHGCRIDLTTLTSERVICSRIVSLKLGQVEVEDDTMRDILAGCPLIEDLTLFECRGLEKVNLSVVRRSLKNFSARSHTTKKNDDRLLLAEFGTADDEQYPNLISLELDKVIVYALFCHNIFSNRFPCLAKFKLRDCEVPKDLKILSDSIKCLSLIRVKNFSDATIHVPKITDFNFTGKIPDNSLVFRTPDSDRKWNSYIDLNYSYTHYSLDALHASQLRNFLTELSSSEISLVIDLNRGDIRTDHQELVRRVNIPIVENLSVKFPQVGTPWDDEYDYSCFHCSAVLCGLLCSCWPKFITPIFVTDHRVKTSYQGKELVYKTLKKHVNKNCSLKIHGIKCIHGLKEVQVEIYDQNLKAWRQHPNPDKAWEPEREQDEIRFSLKWN